MNSIRGEITEIMANKGKPDESKLPVKGEDKIRNEANVCGLEVL